MRSLAVTALSSQPAADASRADDSAGPRLQRLCDYLGLTGARLMRITAYGMMPGAAIGAIPGNLGALETRAIASGQTLVIADTSASNAGAARFYVGILLPADATHPATLISLFDARPRSAAMATTIAALAGEVVAQAVISRQQEQLASQARTIANHTTAEEHRRILFDRASETARIGIWQCTLLDNEVKWTNGVYDLFEIPRGTPITRSISLAHYTEASRLEMEAVRAHAIATCTDFSVTCEIITTKGKHRWMRLTGAVESQNGVATRIFGMKQDITEEKLMADRNRYLAEFDVMTGLANRSQFQSHLDRLDAAPDRHGIGALLLVDLDGFKQINDNHGHALGDECIREAAQRLRDCCAGAELVARIGGDEFAVLIAATATPASIEAQAAEIVEAVRRPLIRAGQRLKLGASVGIAMHAGVSASDLFRQADTALYAAKAAGKGTTRVFEALARPAA